MNDNENDFELNAAERRAFASLSRVSELDQTAEERTVVALRKQRLLRARPGRFRTPLRILTALAAAIPVFIGGMTYGKRIAVQEQAELSPALAVQQTGTAYVAALARLERSAFADSLRTLTAGLEAGNATLRAVAYRAATLMPEDSMITRIRDGLDLASGRQPLPRTTNTIWF